MGEVVHHLLHVQFNVGNLLFRFLDVEFGDLAHGLLAERKDVLARDFLTEKGTVWVKSALDVDDLHVPRVGVLFQLFIDSLFEEDFLQ